MTYRLHGVRVDSEIALADLAASGRHESPDISIRLGPAQGRNRIAAFHQWRVKGSRTVWLSIGRSVDGYQLRFPGLADFRVSATGDCITCHPASRLPRSTLAHLLLDQVLPLAMTRRGLLVLHASAVHIPRCGTIAFVGPTGCGKSTLAAAMGLAGCDVVTDDCLVVHSGTRCVAMPGYPGLRLWQDAARGLGVRDHAGARVAHYSIKRRLVSQAVSFRSKPSPIAALFVIGARRRRGLPTRVRILGARERLMALASCVYLMDVEDRRQLAQMFRSLTSLVARAPVVRLNLRDGRREARAAAVEVLTIARSLADSELINRK